MKAARRSWTVPTVMIRPIKPEDAERLRAFHAQLAPESRRLRFFSFHPYLSDDEVDRFVHVDGSTRAALVAIVGDEIVGVARYEGATDTDAAAEVAVVVRDDMQRQGIATALLDRLGAHAMSKGIEYFTAVTLPENEQVRHLFRSFRSATSSRFGAGVIDVTMPLGSAASDAPS